MKTTAFSKTSAGRTVLSLPELELEEKCVTAVIGPNGSGKSTFARILAGIETAAAGKAGRFPLPCPEILPLVWGLLLSAFLLAYMVTLFTEFLGEWYFYNYTSAFYALLPAAECLTAAGMAKTAADKG